MIACLGLAFKANIDDLRESPAVEIAADLAKRYPGCVLAVEPNIGELPGRLKGELELCALNDALLRADVLVVLVDHTPFKNVDPIRLQAKVVIDTRGMLSRA